MKQDFDAALKFIFEHENVYDTNGRVITENVSGDAGGLTKYGIDQASHPDVDIANLTATQAAQIYRTDYWNRVRGDDLPDPLCYAMMDIAVNNGVHRAITWLQELCNVAIDGRIGPITVAAALKWPVRYAYWLCFRRQGFYHSIATGEKAKFLKGWLNRNNDLLAFIEHGVAH